MERDKFEESLRNAFEQAEIAPPDKVWTNIELDLEKEKGGDLKKRLLFYQMLAAASVVFAMAIGGVGLYYNFDLPRLADNSSAQPSAPSSEGPTDASASATESLDSEIAGDIEETVPAFDLQNGGEGAAHKSETATLSDPASVEDAVKGTDEIVSADDGAHGNMQQRGTLFLANSREKYPELPDALDDHALPPLHVPGQIRLALPPSKQATVDPVVAMMAQLERREKEVQGEEKGRGSADENLWTSIGFAAGSFNAMQIPAANPGPTTMMAMSAATVVDQEAKGSGYSYSMGVNLGTRISERWVLQGGLNYLTHASEYTANNVVVSSSQFQTQRFRPATTNEVLRATENDLSNKLVYSAPYNVNNNMRYLSVPLQAGYLLVNKTFGLQLNAGVATDLFLQNTVTADSDQLDKTSQGGGEDSPYRTLNFSGLFGTEVSYRFGEHYRIALNPGIRYPFSAIYKSELGVQSAPLTFDVGLRFRYIFH